MGPLRALAIAVILAGCAGGATATSPTPTATATASATASPSATAVDHRVVYFARDRLPPRGVQLATAGVGQSQSDRIWSRLTALAKATPTIAGEANLLRGMKAELQQAKVDGDLVTLDFAVRNDDWGVNGSAAVRGLVQQIVYTATEEPGVRRALITQNLGKRAIIGGEGLIVDAPATREQVSGYAQSGGLDRVQSFGEANVVSDLSPRFSVGEIAPALARFVVDARRRDDPSNRTFIPDFSVEVMTAADWKGPDLGGKWVLKLSFPTGADSVPGLRVVDQTPLRAIWTESALGGTGQGGTSYYLGLDDLRPWRVGYLPDPARVIVDVGGDPDAVAAGTVVYQPRVDATVERTFTLSGMARAFEANVLWRVKAPGGAIVARGTMTATLGTSAVWGGYETRIALPATAAGQFTLEVYQPSARDGSDIELVRVPITVR